MRKRASMTPARIVAVTAAAVLFLAGSAGVPAQAAAPKPAAEPAAAASPDGPSDTISPERRDALLPKGWRVSADRLWTTSGDADGFHILTATAAGGYTWETAASLSEPGFDTDEWIGNACLTASGRRVVVVYAPRTFTNRGDLFDRGGFTAIVDLVSHQVTKLPLQASLAYFNPGCGAGEKAVLAQFDSQEHEDPAKTGTRSRLFTVDAAKRTLSKPVLLHTELSSPVPVGDHIVAAGAGSLVSVSSTGRLTRTAAATGVPYRLVPDSSGAVLFQDHSGSQATIKRAVGDKVSVLARGGLDGVGLRRGESGRAFITGAPTSVSPLPSTVRRLAIPPDAEPSVTGDAALTRVTSAAGADPRVTPSEPGRPQAVSITAKVTSTGRQLAFTVTPDAKGPQESTGRAASSELGVTASGAVKKSQAVVGSATDPVDADRYCSVPRNDPANQAVQPKPRNIEWAVDQAITSSLNQYASRPANWKGYGMPAYGPQTLFKPVTLQSGGRVPAQIMLGIITQESNMWQAARYALPGVPANPLMGNFYGREIYNASPADDWDINWANADCGYGLTQATDGMRLAGHEKVGEVALPYQTQRAVALDFAANIAYGLQILQTKWNQTYAAGLRVHNADPSAIENWFFAVWAYNSGFYPDKGDNTPWGVGWLNNPINPRYDPARHPFMTSYDDSRHPQDWPYPEKIIGWAGNPITATESPGVEKAGYNYAWWSSIDDKTRSKPPATTFCTTANQCDPSAKVKPNDPDVQNEPAGPCLHKNATSGLYDLKCYVHYAVGWKAPAGSACNTCGHEQLRFDPGYPWCTSAGQTGCESDGISYPPVCDTNNGELDGNAQVVDDMDNTPSPRRCGTATPNKGTFKLSFASDGKGNYPSKIDFHQIGSGFGGHYWRADTRTAEAQGGSLQVTGTWRLGDEHAVGESFRVQVFVPEFGAWTEQAKYTINLGNGKTRYRVINQTWQQNKWVDLGVFYFSDVPSVTLTTVAKDGTGDDSVIFDAVAFTHVTEPGPKYVALGDSYSSGEGNSPYDKNSDLQRTNGTLGSPVNACHRAQANAYPRMVKMPGYGLKPNPDPNGNNQWTIAEMAGPGGGASIGFLACSGAGTTEVTRDAVNSPPAESDTGGHTDWGSAGYQWGELTQVEQGWLDEDTTDVSITIGGNDARFADVMRGCIAALGSCDATDYKLTRPNGKVDPEPLRDYETKIIRDWLPSKLVATYRAIHRAAPHARIFVLGYPQLFPDEEGNNACWNIGSQARLFLNALAGRLSITTAKAVDTVHADGVDIRYVDATLKFRLGADGDKHWACDGTSGKQWLNGVTSTTNDGSGSSTPGTGSWHPTAAGQQAYADILGSAFAGDSSVGAVKQRILNYVATKSGERWVITDRQAELAAQRCLDLARRGGLVGDPCMNAPILFPSVFDAGAAALNDDAAIAGNPRWVLGNYASDAEKSKAVVGARGWIDNSRYGQTKCPSPRPIDTNCDEFPFFASEQGVSWDFWTGGQDSPLSTRLQIVPAAENRADGRLLGNIVSSGGCVTTSATYSANAVVNGGQYWGQLLSNGSPFLTIPLTDAAENVDNKSFYVC